MLLQILHSGYGTFLVGFVILSLFAIIMQKIGREVHPTILAILFFSLGGVSLYLIFTQGV